MVNGYDLGAKVFQGWAIKNPVDYYYTGSVESIATWSPRLSTALRFGDLAQARRFLGVLSGTNARLVRVYR
jgi:hypothetical protein